MGMKAYRQTNFPFIVPNGHIPNFHHGPSSSSSRRIQRYSWVPDQRSEQITPLHTRYSQLEDLGSLGRRRGPKGRHCFARWNVLFSKGIAFTRSELHRTSVYLRFHENLIGNCTEWKNPDLLHTLEPFQSSPRS